MYSLSVMPITLPTMGTLSMGERHPPLRAPTIIILGKKTPMGNRIKERRKALGLTQEQLAKLAGTTKNQLVKLENGDRRFSDHWAERLAPHLNCKPYELFMTPGHDINHLRMVPLVGHISCGNWQEAIEHADGMVPAIARGVNVFALKALGDSMNQLIQDDGYVYVDPDDTDLIDGKIYAIMNGDGETTAKQFKADPARLVPCSNNPEYQEMIIGKARFTVIGRIVGTYSPL